MRFREIHRLLTILRSGRTALVLLLASALIAAAGTLYTPEQSRRFLGAAFGDRGVAVAEAIGVVDVFHGRLFVGVLIAIGVSVALCTWHRLPLIAALCGNFPGLPRRRWAVVADAGMHFSVLVVLAAGAAESLFGFVGTKNLPVGVAQGAVFDWRSGRDVPLGFEIVIDALELHYFPTLAKIGVTDRASGRRSGLLTVREGASTEVSAGSLALQDLRYDPVSQSIEMVALLEGRPERVRFSTVPTKAAIAVVHGYELTLVAWRRDLREAIARASILESGRTVRQGRLRVNGRLRSGGWNIYLTAWGRDEFGNDFAGIQVTRDPGAVLFWFGSVLFTVCLAAFLPLRHRMALPGSAPTASGSS